MTRSSTPVLVVALGCLVLSGCAAVAATSNPDAASARSLTAECRSLAAQEKNEHGVDELARLPAICARLSDAVTAHARDPGAAGPKQAFDAGYGECVNAGKHRGANFSYRGHPGAPETYRRVRDVCEAFAAAFAKAKP